MEAQGLLDQELCYRALTGRDARFDGRFFVCVKTTGIYCRPVCPARTPKRGNCLFVPSAAAAQTLGYRSCLRCRPESAPGTAAWAGTEASVARALRPEDARNPKVQHLGDFTIVARHQEDVLRLQVTMNDPK